MKENKCANFQGKKVCESGSLPHKRGHKIFRKVAICTLAGFMGVLGFLSTACTPSSPNAGASPSTENAGLITPRADDPIILTTTSGLEIKYGNATISPSLASGNLAGFPYFTTNDGSKDYTWVIIGLNSTTPDNSQAGSAIANDANANWQKVHEYMAWTDDLCHNAEIPANCALVLYNACATTSAYCYSHLINGKTNSGYSTTDIRYKLDGFYDADSYGISEIKDLIEPVDLTTYGVRFNEIGEWERFSDKTEKVHLFILSGNPQSSFYAFDYLSSNQMNVGSNNSWLRGLRSSDTMLYANSYPYVNYHTDSTIYIGASTSYYYIRPAFCMRIV